MGGNVRRAENDMSIWSRYWPYRVSALALPASRGAFSFPTQRPYRLVGGHQILDLETGVQISVGVPLRPVQSMVRLGGFQPPNGGFNSPTGYQYTQAAVTPDVKDAAKQAGDDTGRVASTREWEQAH